MLPVNIHFDRALWDYEAQEDNEISFLAGDVFAVVEMQNDDWWEGVIGEQRGYFPANRVEVVVERRAVTGVIWKCGKIMVSSS